MRLHSTLSPSSREASRTAKSIAYIRMPDCDFIDQAIASHGEWKRQLQKVIATGESDTPVEVIARDDRCAFGAWLCGPSLSAMDKASIYYETIRVLHAEFHSAAALVLQLALDGNKKAATDMLAIYGEFTAISSKLTHALAEWKRVAG